MKGWQNYADRMPTEQEVEQWEQWPGAGICLPLGGVSRLMAIDCDVEGDPLTALEFALAGLLVCRKRGSKGFTAFLRCDGTPWAGKNELLSKFDITLPDTPIDPRTGLHKPTRAVDIIAYGKQTVVPPSVHPNGKPYEWMTEMRLDTCEVDYDIPRVPPDIIERIVAALEPWTTDRDRAARDRDQRVKRVDENDSWYRELNNHALANLHLWVPALVHSKFLRDHGQEGYRAIPYWRGVFDAPKVGIHPSGIVDFATDQKYTPLDLVMAIKQVEVPDAIDWLEHTSQMPQPEPVATSAFLSALGSFNQAHPVGSGQSHGPTGVAAPVPDASDGQMQDQSLGFTFDPAAAGELSPTAAETHPTAASQKQASPQTTPASPDPTPTHLPSYVASPPGKLGEIARYITNSAFRPQPQLSTAAAIIFAATVMGQLYRGPTGSRTNIYLMGVAESGAGKDHPFKCVHRLLGAANMADFAGGSAMASGTAVQSRLAWQPNTVYLIDEIGMLLSRLNAAGAGGHEREITDILMQAYSSADMAAFRGKDYADRQSRGTTEARYPCLNLFGVTTPAALFDSLSSAEVLSGFLNRFLLVESEDLPRPQHRDRHDPNDIPNDVIEWATELRSPRPVEGAPLRGLSAESPILIDYADDGVADAFERFLFTNDERMRALRKEQTGVHSMLVRLPEQALKLAMIAGAATDHERPRITEEAFTWAQSYAAYYSDRLIRIVRSRIADSPFEKQVKLAYETIARHGTMGMTQREMVRNSRVFKSMQNRELHAVIERLLAAEQCVWVDFGRRHALVAADAVQTEGGEE